MTGVEILYEDEYVHVVNNETGIVELVEGPARFVLPATKSIVGSKKKKITLKDNQFCVIKNPFDKERGELEMGRRVVVRGPKTFCLHPGEKELPAEEAYLLNKNQYLVVQSNNYFEDANGVKRSPGDLYNICGPTLFIPNKDEEILYDPKTRQKLRNAISIPDGEAVYVRNTDTSELKLVKGPLSYVPAVNEEEYEKLLDALEYDALELSGLARSQAYVINVQKSQCLCVLNYKDNTERYILGPDRVILGPHEGLKVLQLSGGVPKQEGVVKAATIGLGIDFMTDQFTVRTKDNAVLNLTVSYKWRFIIDELVLDKIFAGDFIGYACQSLRSRIREESSRNDFEAFHTNSSQILRDKLFKDYEIEVTKENKRVKEKFSGRFFSEFNFLIFAIDVKEIKPVDREIEQLLENSIKSSMRIMCSKLNDNAETQAEKERIESEIDLCKLRKNLIEIENNNLTKEKIEKAKIEGKALVEKASSEAQADALLHKSALDLELLSMKEQMELLEGSAGDRYIEYVKIMSLANNVGHATVVPNSTRSIINVGYNGGLQAIEDEE